MASRIAYTCDHCGADIIAGQRWVVSGRRDRPRCPGRKEDAKTTDLCAHCAGSEKFKFLFDPQDRPNTDELENQSVRRPTK